MFLTIYKPEGIHTKDNPCNCKYCGVWPEFFHAAAYYTCIVSYDFQTALQLAREIRNEKYPDGVILFTNPDARGGSIAIREDGSKLTYNKAKHRWFNEDGTMHSTKEI